MRWWLIALLPKWAAKKLWQCERTPLGGWAPYVLGQALGRRGEAKGGEG